MPARPPTASTESVRLSFLERLVAFVLQVVAIGLGAWIAMRLPLPLLDDWLPVKNVVVAIGAVVLTGKVLFDTFFYDHFWP